MTSFTWTNTSGGLWSDSGSWSPAGGPPSSDTGRPDDVQFIANSGTVSYGSGYTVTIDDATGSEDLAQDLTIANAITIALGGNELQALGSTTFTAGTLTLDGGELDAGANDDSTMANGALIIGNGVLSNSFVGTGGTIEAQGGTLEIYDPLFTSSISYQIDIGSTLKIDDGAQTGTSFSFLGGSGSTLILGPPTDSNGIPTGHLGFDGTVTGLIDGGSPTVPANDIDIAGADVTASLSGDVITITGMDQGVTLNGTIQLSGAYVGTSQAEVISDGSGGTEIFLYNTAVCFAEGTRILTSRGEVAVESLTEGDTVITTDQGNAQTSPVRWIGRRYLDLTNHPHAQHAAPVRIRRGAFAENQPQRDLLVSPDHCLFVDGKLIPAKLLINGMTILQETSVKAVTYYHVELDRHAVLLAEGLPAESYLDTGNRAFFSNAGLALILHPEFHVNAGLKCWETDACAPLAVSEAAVRPSWSMLAARARTLGFEQPEVLTTDDADLRIVATGRTFRPVSSNANRYVFVLPAGITQADLVSRAGSPADVKPWLDDHRQLGVAVSRIVVRGGTEYIEVPVDHPALRQGWHSVETQDRAMWRWTNGRAALPIAATTGPVTIEVHLRATGTYVVATANTARRLAA